jgi:two-component system sensor histidine kinase KdpD
VKELQRPDPDALLAGISRSEAKERRGKLKVFFGMAPGVGKTYAMLKDAHQRVEEGVDVLGGVVETHGRAETMEMLEGLNILPKRQVNYRGVKLEEMDLDAIIERKPQLVLVDELAHTNVEGSRHPKRYQDVLELLDLGIDVSTTLNVQHVESRSDSVHQITGVPVHETVPDSVFDLADEIQLIDLPPDQLLERLAEGKVYLGDRAKAASLNFFKGDNLTALRELSLRVTAERVDQELREIRQGKANTPIWRSSEKFMVAVGPSPFSMQLVRQTRRLAYAQDAPWLAVSVTGKNPLSISSQHQLDKNLSAARELGAEVILTRDEHTVDALIRIAQQNNVTQIVLGQTHHHVFFRWMTGGTLVDQLIARDDRLHLYIVPSERPQKRKIWSSWQFNSFSRFHEYLISLGVVGGISTVSWLLVGLCGYRSIALIYLLGVILLGLFVGRGPVLFGAVVSGICWDFLFIPPIFTFVISRFEDNFMLGIFLVIALVTGQLTSRIRTKERDERRREQRSQALYQLVRSIAASSSTGELLESAAKKIGDVFGCRAAFLLADSEGRLSLMVHRASTFTLDEKEYGVAAWAYANRRVAGLFTDSLPSAKGLHIPLVRGDHVVGVMGISPINDENLSLDQRDLLESFAQQLALVLDNELLRTRSTTAEVWEKTSLLQRTLLNSISHELKTPLAAIQVASDELSLSSPDGRQRGLILEINEALDRLKRLVKNLLDSARLESTQLAPKREWGEVKDLVEEAVALAGSDLRKSQLSIILPDNLPLIHVDFGLLGQAVANLLHNAAVHTPEGTRITLSAYNTDDALVLLVADEGTGIPPDLLPHLFEKFYRASDARPGGTGLGLSIARGFVEAHGGTLEAYNQHAGRGAVFVIRLPLGKKHLQKHDVL